MEETPKVQSWESAKLQKATFQKKKDNDNKLTLFQNALGEILCLFNFITK